MAKVVKILQADSHSSLALPLAGGGIAAGFPSPASDYMEQSLDLNKELIKNPGATFLGRAKGNSMVNAGISNGDVLVIDKSLAPYEGATAVCCLNGEFTLKTISFQKEGLFLLPANPEFPPIKVEEENDFMVWGIVTYVIKKMR